MSGVVLAGGASRRMGADKAALVVDGETLLARAVRHLEEAGAAPVVVASGVVGRRGHLPWPEVDDGPFAGAGPLAGVLAALRRSTAPVVAVLAVDLPDASPAVFQWLRDEWRARDTALVPVDADGRAQPLHALIASSDPVAGAIESHLGGGERRVQRVLASLGARHLEVPDLLGGPTWSRNWNAAE